MSAIIERGENRYGFHSLKTESHVGYIIYPTCEPDESDTLASVRVLQMVDAHQELEVLRHGVVEVSHMGNAARHHYVSPMSGWAVETQGIRSLVNDFDLDGELKCEVRGAASSFMRICQSGVELWTHLHRNCSGWPELPVEWST